VTADRRVLIVSSGRIVGGAERSMLELATRLPKHGWSAVVTCPYGPLADRAAELGLETRPRAWSVVRPISDKTGPVKRYAPRRVLAAATATTANGVRLAGLIRSSEASVVLSNSLPTHLVTALATRITPRPCAWYLRDIVEAGRGRRVLEAAGRTVPLVLSISRAVTGAMRHPRIVTIPEPIEPPDTWPPRASAAGGRLVVGYIGRLDQRKGVEDVCALAGEVDVHVRIAGEPLLADRAYVDGLRALADRVAPGRVEFLGGVPSPWPFLASVDVLVVPSRREPWGRVAAEALMSGVPVVASRTGGLPEIVRDGVDGFLYEPGDVAALAAHVRRLAADPALRERLRAGALAGADRFDPDNHAAAVAAALDELVGARG
jgi:glycosyltransferase involved in cell wall biosynthesis